MGRMRGQLSAEFLTIFLIMVVYLGTTLALYKTVRGSLEMAVDRQVLDRFGMWADFVAPRPVGTQVKLELKIFPGRWMAVSCEGETLLATPSTELKVNQTCSGGKMNLTGDTCVWLTSIEGGFRIEEC